MKPFRRRSKGLMQLAMPLSSQEIFPVVTALNHLEISPSHQQSEDMVTDKPPGAEVSLHGAYILSI